VTASASRTRLTSHRPRGWAALVLGVGALAVAAVVALMSQRTTVVRFTLSAGAAGTTRARVAEALVDAARFHGAEARLVAIPEASDELAEVNEGRVDLALLSGVYHLGPHDHVREVGPLYVEALHLLVKSELADDVTRDLGALRGHGVDLGPHASETEDLARMALVFAQLAAPGAGSPPLETTNLEYDELQKRFEAGDHSALPDAIFQLAIVPSQLALPLLRTGGYRLVPLPFADAMRLNALASHIVGAEHEVDWQYVTDATIPPFTYSMRPPIPAAPLQTVGSRLLLVANERVPSETVELILEAAFRSRFARIADPPLDPSVLKLPPRLHLHPGTIAYMRRDDPLLTADSVDTMSNMLSIIGAVVGGSLFLFQWRRQRETGRRDDLFGSYVQRAADIERRLAALELSATLDLPRLIELQREVLQVKTEALERFASGELGSQTALFQLLEPLNTTRDQIGDLLLHVRQTLEDRAAEEGRSEQAVWRDAAKGTREPTNES
jgi:TRAP-type uncharacterized transport system substrate-binding protein